jgi:hypothetical protein
MYGSSYMFWHYIAIPRERSYCLLRCSIEEQSIVDGRVVSSDVVRGDLRLDTTDPSTIFYRLLLKLVYLLVFHAYIYWGF